MKLLHKMLSNPIDFDEKCVQALVLENPKLYRRAILSMIEEEGDTCEDFILSDTEKTLSIKRICEVITDPFRLDSVIDKKTVGFIHKDLAQIATHELFQETAELFSGIHEYLMSLLELSEKELRFDDGTDPSILLHAFHVRPDMTGLDFCEKILYYMELMYEYAQKRLFVFCGLHSCLSKEEITAFLKDVRYRKFLVLLLEPRDCEAYDGMGKRILDNDFCEI